MTTLFLWIAKKTFTLLVFMGSRPVRKTILKIKGAIRQISYVIKMKKTVQRSDTLDIPTQTPNSVTLSTQPRLGQPPGRQTRCQNLEDKTRRFWTAQIKTCNCRWTLKSLKQDELAGLNYLGEFLIDPDWYFKLAFQWVTMYEPSSKGLHHLCVNCGESSLTFWVPPLMNYAS